MKKILIGEVNNFSEIGMKSITVEGKKLMLVHTPDGFYVCDDLCTHSQCSLSSEGFLEGNVVTCGCHGAQFDVKTGKVLSLPAVVNLQTYTVHMDQGKLFIEI